MNNKIFLSVGGVANEEQEAFIKLVEDRLRAEGLVPHTVGRNTFSSDAPLKTVMRLLDECSGTVVIALERLYFAEGMEKRHGPSQRKLSEVKISTPWNQIEAAMAYNKGHPLLVIVEEGLRTDGLLEKGYDWYIQSMRPISAALATQEFNGVLASWKAKVLAQKVDAAPAIQVAELTIGKIVSSMKFTQFWAAIAFIGGLAAASFVAGYNAQGFASKFQAQSEPKAVAAPK
jgi:hypothetical protein